MTEPEQGPKPVPVESRSEDRAGSSHAFIPMDNQGAWKLGPLAEEDKKGLGFDADEVFQQVAGCQ